MKKFSGLLLFVLFVLALIVAAMSIPFLPTHTTQPSPATAASCMFDDGAFVCNGALSQFVCDDGDDSEMFASADIYGVCYYMSIEDSTIYPK